MCCTLPCVFLIITTKTVLYSLQLLLGIGEILREKKKKKTKTFLISKYINCWGAWSFCLYSFLLWVLLGGGLIVGVFLVGWFDFFYFCFGRSFANFKLGTCLYQKSKRDGVYLYI